MSEGKLILVPTPIGNMDDITIRALNVLKEVDAILCEDTRHTGKLLSHHGIKNQLHAFHQHNEHKVSDRLCEAMVAGTTYALVTDAGTPGVSDPGYLLIKACHEKGVATEVLPGATAVITALVGSGLPCDRYVFLGFPPHKKGRKTFWEGLMAEPRTMVLYESPHRIQKALTEAANALGEERRACIARELTKKFETYHRDTLAALIEQGEKAAFKGEIVLVIEGGEQYKKRVNS